MIGPNLWLATYDMSKTYDWLLNKTSQSYALFTNLLVNSLWTLQQICEVRNEVRHLSWKSNMKLTVIFKMAKIKM